MPLMRVGVIGAGNICPAHLRGLSKLPRVQIVGLLDINPTAAQKVASQFGIHHFSGLDNFYNEARPDIVHILTPPRTHEQLTLDALDRGAHVLLEKPLSLTVAGCKAVQAKAESKGLTVGIDENAAFSPPIRAAVAAIERGEVGRLIHISCFFGFDASDLKPDLSNWSWAKELPGGVLEDLLPHPLTVIRALAGRELRLIHKLVSRSGRLRFDDDDELRLSLTAGQESTADIMVSLSAHPANFTVTVYGTRATMKIDVRNALVDLSRIGNNPGALRKGLDLAGSAVRALGQITHNAIAFGLLRTPKPMDPIHLMRVHYDALGKLHAPPASIRQAEWVVHIARQIWPMS